MMNARSVGLLSFFALGCAFGQTVPKASPADIEFFETKVRPVLAKNCYGCHASDIKSPMGGLFVDSRTGLLKGGKSGPAIVPGDANGSLFIRAVRYQGPKMPPAGPLSEAVVADLEKWVAAGAPEPVEMAAPVTASTIDIEKGRKYWAFQPPTKPAPPSVHNAKWPAGPVDRFVLARMEKEHLTPVADAGRDTWIRRVTLDLTGLLPTPEEIDAFLADRSKDAYAKVADRLLASPRFGERWGRHWLDVARYADTIGRGRNYPFPFAWRYRDWVIDAFNSDMPYDRFVREQLAGDLLPSDSPQQHNRQLTATGFLTLGSLDLVEQNPAVFLMDAVDEQINATSRAFMGVTVGCARCHDHKFDPIPTTDYYAMAGIFRSTMMLSGLQRRPRDNASYFSTTLLAKLTHGPDETLPEFLSDPADRTEYDRLQSQLAELNQNPRRALAKLGVTAQQGAGAQMQAGQKIRQAANQILGQLDRFPLPPDLVMGVRDAATPADCEVHVKGEVNDLGPSVARGFPQVLSKPGETAGIASNESGRLELAQWLTRRENPTTARVEVNRIWQHLFGRGIVASADNFGLMGEKPSDQPLLDYLAVRFMEQGWSTKKLIRELVLSRTYRLSTADSPRNDNIDPGNVFFWRANRQRLEIEPIRDSLLMIAGNLDLNPPVASPVMSFRRSVIVGGGRGGPQQDFASSLRTRTVYVPVVRNFLPAMFETFDFPEPSETKGVREVTTVPTQALFLMNSQFVIQQARSAAQHLLSSTLATPQARITRAYRETLGRLPTAAEMERAMIFIHSDQETAEAQPVPEQAAASGRRPRPRANGGRGAGRGGPIEVPLERISPEASAWEHFYQALFASAEFRYRS